jgi:hypothetical protein
MNQSQPNSAKDKPTKGEAENASPSVSEGEDFYLEGGLMVFTERFLRKRGYCCESGCRHCPYGFSKKS